MTESKGVIKISIWSDNKFEPAWIIQAKCISICEKLFIRSAHLTIHKLRNTLEKPFKCLFCEEVFSQSGHLTAHKLSHTGEKPFKCMFCEKGFSQSITLTRHRWSHTVEKPFKCMFCENAFSWSPELMDQMPSSWYTAWQRKSRLQ